MSHRNAKVVSQVKESFLTLTQQFENMAKMLNVHAHLLAEDKREKSPEGKALAQELVQFQQMGEQLKTLGTGIDLMGGKPVLQPGKGMRVVSGTPKELKERGYNVSQFIPGWPGKDGE